MDDCVFCKIIKKEAPALVIDENEQVLTFLSLENHPLIVTKNHIQDIYALDDESGAAVMSEAIKISKALRDGLDCDGVNLVQGNGVVANQDVFHFHLHVKPRWKNDTVILHWDTNPVDEDSRKQTLVKIKQALS